MSRTDKDQPEWVRALHDAQDGRPTNEWHSVYCAERGLGRDWAIRRVLRADAETNGWPIAWASGDASTRVYAYVPFGPFPCDIDRPAGRCTRWVGDRHRWYCYSPPSHDRLHAHYFGPERAAVRDALRDVVKDYRGAAGDGGVDDWDPVRDVPVRQARRSTWAGGWWD